MVSQVAIPPSTVDRARIAELYPPLAVIIVTALPIAQDLLDRAQPGVWTIAVWEAGRSRARQLELYKKGRVLAPGGRPLNPADWILQGKTVTNALPDQCAHCVVNAAGDPRSMACDLRVYRRDTGETCPDGHPAWSAIAAAAYLAGADQIDLGAMFTTIKGGDWPHIQWAGWAKLVRNCVLIEKQGAS